MKRVVAVDQSFTSCGIVVLDENGDIEFAERYVSDNNDDYFSRAWEVATHIAEVAREHNVNYCVLEGLAFGAMGNQTRNLAGLQYVIYSVMKFIEGHQVEIVGAGSAKKRATGSGNAGKDEMVENLPEDVLGYFKATGAKKTTGLRDLSDAYWIGIFFQETEAIESKQNNDLEKSENE